MNLPHQYRIDESQISHNDFDGETVIIHFPSGNYFSLTGSAPSVWRWLCESPASPGSLLSQFSDPPAEALEQITQFLDTLVERQLATRTPRAAADETPRGLAAPAPYEPPRIESFEDLQALLMADVIHETDEQGWPRMAADGGLGHEAG